MKSQRERVIEKLDKDGYVDNFWAIEHYILRLGAIICDLKKEGWEFNGHFGEDHERKNYIYKEIKRPELKLF